MKRLGILLAATSLLAAACSTDSSDDASSTPLRPVRVSSTTTVTAQPTTTTQGSTTTTVPGPCDTPGQDLSGKDLSDADLTGRDDLRCSKFINTNLRGADLSGADLTGGVFVGSDFTGANLTDANMTHGWISISDFAGATVAGLTLDESFVAELRLVSLESPYGISMRSVTSNPDSFEPYPGQVQFLDPANLSSQVSEWVVGLNAWASATFPLRFPTQISSEQDIDIDVTRLDGALITFGTPGTLQLSSQPSFRCNECKFSGTITGDFDHARLPESSFVGILAATMDDADLDDAYFGIGAVEECSFEFANLHEANLAGPNPSGGLEGPVWGCSFAGANVSDANLAGVNLTGANLSGISGHKSANWNNAICPDGTPAKDNLQTCV